MTIRRQTSNDPATRRMVALQKRLKAAQIEYAQLQSYYVDTVNLVGALAIAAGLDAGVVADPVSPGISQLVVQLPGGPIAFKLLTAELDAKLPAFGAEYPKISTADQAKWIRGYLSKVRPAKAKEGTS